MQLTKSKLSFDNSGFYFVGLLAVVIAGFWPSYFFLLLSQTVHFTLYFHLHAVAMILWILMLIVQPILIRSKKIRLHRTVGQASYVLFPLMLTSIILIINQRHPSVDEADLDLALFGQFRPFIVFAVAYGIAIRYRHNVGIHARAMIATGISIIEPALTRLILNVFATLKIFDTSPNFFYYVSITTISIISLLVIALIIRERHQKEGRWLLPSLFSLYLITYLVSIFRIHIGLAAFARWFFALPLT